MKTKTVSKLAVIVSLAQSHLAMNASVIIGFNECQSVASYSQAQMNAIGQLNFFFAHASVGANMMSGLASLHSGNSGFYQLTSQSDNEIPPDTTQSGIVYEYARGNPGWANKISYFTTYVNNGWNSPKVDIAINKFCYIDEAADFTTYINAMTSLESAHADTRFVYMTIPLTGYEDAANYQRQQFNTALRNWVISNDRVLYDIADIEAHSPSGVEQTFEYNSTTCQKLYSGYSSDDSHPNQNGGPELIASGFYALGKELAVVPEPSMGTLLIGIGCLSAAWIIRARRSN